MSVLAGPKNGGDSSPLSPCPIFTRNRRIPFSFLFNIPISSCNVDSFIHSFFCCSYFVPLLLICLSIICTSSAIILASRICGNKLSIWSWHSTGSNSSIIRSRLGILAFWSSCQDAIVASDDYCRPWLDGSSSKCLRTNNN